MNRLPAWFQQPFPQKEKVLAFKDLLQNKKVYTVCQGAQCPNLTQCWQKKVATFMILGNICTRSCRFCAVTSGIPKAVDAQEPWAVADAVCAAGLDYVVVTSVTRDDLPDQGAQQFCETVAAIRARSECIRIELLIPDLSAEVSLIERVVCAKPHVIGHNVETVERLTCELRPQADYGRSLKVLRTVKEKDACIAVKSGFMLGLGETEAEIAATMHDLRENGCDILTLGQYLAPSRGPRHIAVRRFVTPQEFEQHKQKALALGFKSVVSGPLVRSSYMAKEAYEACGGVFAAAER